MCAMKGAGNLNFDLRFTDNLILWLFFIITLLLQMICLV